MDASSNAKALMQLYKNHKLSENLGLTLWNKVRLKLQTADPSEDVWIDGQSSE